MRWACTCYVFRVGQATSSSRFLPETGARHIIRILPCHGSPPLTLYEQNNSARFSVSGCAICNPLARGEWVGAKLIHVAGLYEAS